MMITGIFIAKQNFKEKSCRITDDDGSFIFKARSSVILYICLSIDDKKGQQKMHEELQKMQSCQNQSLHQQVKGSFLPVDKTMSLKAYLLEKIK